MANFELLKQGLVAVIKENGNQEITGQLLQQQLLAIINSLGAGYLLIGAATTTTNPGTPDQNVAYLAIEPGTYTNFGGLEVTDPLVLLKWNGQWSQETLSTGIKALFAAVISDIEDINAAIVAINATILSLQNNKADKNGWYNGLVAGAAENLIGQMPASAFFTYRQTDDGKAGTGAAQIQTIKGRTLKWNQICPIPPVSKSAEIGGIIYVDNRDGSYSVSGTAERQVDLNIWKEAVPSHKYLIFGAPGFSGTLIRIGTYNGSYLGTETGSGAIVSTTDGLGLDLRVNAGTVIPTSILFEPNCIDLTDYFGAGNEPATVAEATALLPKFPYAYNAGTLLPFKGATLKMTGFNQWDEQWEVGNISTTTGEPTPATGVIRAKNYSHCIGGATYNAKLPAGVTGIRLYYYDAAKTYLSASLYSTGTLQQAIPTNARYFKLIAGVSSYANDICFNLSDPTKNGQYEPFQENTLNINVIGKTAKDSNNNPIIPYPVGMNGVGAYFDKATRDGGNLVFSGVDMGTLSWSKEAENTFMAILSDNLANNKNFICSAPYTIQNPGYYNSAYNDKSIWLDARSGNHAIYVKDSAYSDAASFKSAMNGVELVYLLESPIPFTWDEPLPLNYPVNRLGTEMLEPTGVDENGVPQTAPLTAEIIYPIDAIGTLLGLPQDYISQGSDINQLEAMKSAGLITAYTRTFNATTGKYEYTFTV